MPMTLIINNIRMSKGLNYVVVFIGHSDLAHCRPYGEIVLMLLPEPLPIQGHIRYREATT